MRWTRGAAVVAALAALPGCAVWMESRVPAGNAYDPVTRPASAYYCYDCHGYRYFDPYYDWCVAYGFRFAWDHHPETVRAYRERYVRIKEQNPGFGRYRYRTGYREARRYREPQDYDSWRVGPGGIRSREQDGRQPGTNQGKRTKEWKDRKRQPSSPPRDPRPDRGARPGTPGGA